LDIIWHYKFKQCVNDRSAFRHEARFCFISHSLSSSYAICSSVSHKVAWYHVAYSTTTYTWTGARAPSASHSEINNGARIYAVCARSYRGSTHRSFYRVCSLSGNASFRVLIDESQAHPAFCKNIFFSHVHSAGITPYCTTSKNDLQ